MPNKVAAVVMGIAVLLLGSGASPLLAHTINYTVGNSYILTGLHYHGSSSGYVDWRPYNLSSAWTDYFRSADWRWNNATSSPVYCYRLDSSPNLVQNQDLPSPLEARVMWTPEGSFSVAVDEVQCSTYSTERKSGIAVHELGHAIGLGDLTYAGDTDQVMYYYSNSRAAYPYSNMGEMRGDIYGAHQVW